MTVFSCQCLNTQVSVRETLDEIQTSPLMHCDQLPGSPKHRFFKQGVYEVVLDICGITNEIEELTSCMPITPDWTIYSCLCCNIETHAIHKPTQMHVTSTQLLTADAMAALQLHERFSPVYHVVLPPATGAEPPLSYSTSQLPPDVQKQYCRYVKGMESACQRRVDVYRQQQRQELGLDTGRAKADSYTLLALLERLNKLQLEESPLAPSAADYMACMGSYGPGQPSDMPALVHQSGADHMEGQQSGAGYDEEMTQEDLYMDGRELVGDHDTSPLSSSASDYHTDLDDDYFQPQRRNDPVLVGSPKAGYSYAAPVTREDPTPPPRGSDSDSDDMANPRRAEGGYDIPSAIDGDDDDFGGPPLAQSVPITIPYLGGPTRPRRLKRRETKVIRTNEQIAASILAISKSMSAGGWERPRPKLQGRSSTLYEL